LSETVFIPPAPKLRGEAIISRPFPLGHLLYFQTMAKNPLETWGPNAFRTPIIPIEFLGRRYVVINDPAAIRHCFVTNAANFRLNFLRLKMLKPALRDGLIVAEGETWKTARRALTPIFTPRHVAGFAPAMQRASETARDRLIARAGSRISLRDEMLLVALDVLIACLFPEDDAFDRKAFSRNVSRLLELGGTPHPFDLMRAPDALPRVGRMGLGAAVEALRAQVGELLQRYRMRGAGEAAPATFLSLLAAARTEDGAPLSDDTIIDQLLTFLTAGHETTARALAWALYALSEAPDARGRVEAELAAHDWSADPATWEDRLPYLQATIKETLRLYPPAPHLAREAIGPDRIGDIGIDAGTEVHMSPWLLHRQETLWRQPTAFMPERFYGAAGAEIDRFAFLPFGVGPRVCIGASFSMLEMSIVLAILLSALRFRHVGEQPPVPVLRITLQPSTPMMALVERR
jgi:cytochrome P450